VSVSRTQPRSLPATNIRCRNRPSKCINGLGDSSESDAIVHAVAGLAMSLSMTTTAEGVETREQLDRVRELGCTDVQGFFYSPPVPLRDLAKIFAKQGVGVVAA
jgi:EAL domain-containing protein (putative c-di-GMP-specific phosphodiesterase class I)